MFVHFPPPKTKTALPIDAFLSVVQKHFPGAECVWEEPYDGLPGHYVIVTKMTIVAQDDELFVEPYDAKNENPDNVIDFLSHPKFLAAHPIDIPETAD